MATLRASVLLFCIGIISAADIPIEGFPSVSDPDDLGQRSAIILFLQEHKVPYALGIDDDHLLDIYQKYWIALRKAEASKAKLAAPPAPAAVAPSDDERLQDIARDNIKLQLKLQYNYTDTVGKTLPQLQAALDSMRNSEAPAGPASGGDVAGPGVKGPAPRKLTQAEVERRAEYTAFLMGVWKAQIEAELARRRAARAAEGNP